MGRKRRKVGDWLFWYRIGRPRKSSLVVHVEGPHLDEDEFEEVWYTYLTVHNEDDRVEEIVESCKLGVHYCPEEAWRRAERLARYYRADLTSIDPKTDDLLGYWASGI